MFSKLTNSNTIFNFIVGSSVFLFSFLFIESFIIHRQQFIVLERLDILEDLLNQVLLRKDNLGDAELLSEKSEKELDDGYALIIPAGVFCFIIVVWIFFGFSGGDSGTDFVSGAFFSEANLSEGELFRLDRLIKAKRVLDSIDMSQLNPGNMGVRTLLLSIKGTFMRIDSKVLSLITG